MKVSIEFITNCKKKFKLKIMINRNEQIAREKVLKNVKQNER